MLWTRTTHRLALCLALLALLAAALMPALGQVLARQQGRAETWAEVCSTTGGKRLVKLDLGTPTPAGMDGLAHAKHCPFCLAHGGQVVLPPPEVASLPLDIAKPVLPPLYYHAPRPLYSWAATRSRGPPAYA